MTPSPVDPTENAESAENTEYADLAGVGCRTPAPVGARRPVVLLTGPSGAGKSRLAARLATRTGWPVVRLDDFYREIDDPRLPRSGLGIPDWDHPQSWNTGRLAPPLQAEGLLAHALCVRQNRYVTAFRRFVRDLAERRKPPHILVRRGWSLLREEPDVVAAASAQGARPATPREAERDLAPLLDASS